MKYLLIVLFVIFIGCSSSVTTYKGYEIFNSGGQVCVHKTTDTTTAFKCFNTLDQAVIFIDKSQK